MTDDSVPAPATERYQADALILYGVKLNDRKDYARFDFGDGHLSDLRMQLFRDQIGSKSGEYSIVLAYGYAFEGHCYRFDSTRVFLITADVPRNAVGCGFDDLGYKMWSIRASDALLEILISYGDAKTLILDANLPGKRSPNSYAITLRMAHRDGRLTRD
ncbi:hypothetical protein [Rhizobium leguminosarum]|uniref:Uncharacterized protein n=1 Tax=Rhizobium leguminosarum TaxID=384 RepID=A0A1B1CKU9_RHILE|nr:hypothetical protein [Rhizobium leguminosarum]ANP90387.1 hypothetical protein BA011_31040 [Rhizobium leguminosarum]